LSKYKKRWGTVMRKVFAPGCALMIYKPELGKKVLEFLNGDLGLLRSP
jgi:hypothetical protein